MQFRPAAKLVGLPKGLFSVCGVCFVAMAAVTVTVAAAAVVVVDWHSGRAHTNYSGKKHRQVAYGCAREVSGQKEQRQ